MASFWLGPVASARGFRVFGFDEIGSTSTEAARAAGAGDAGDVWFAALRQTAGRGRRGRVWETPSGNLAASLLLVPGCDPAAAATLGFVAGIALNRALIAALPAGVVKQGIDGADGAGHRLALKWPNDVLADGAKLAGILLEAHKRPDGSLAVVIGFGVNVVYAPSGLPYPATSLADLGLAASAETLFATLAEEWVVAYELWNGGRNVGAVLAEWRSAAAGIGAEVAVKRDTDVVRGIFENIDESGRLIVRANDNSRIAISAGDVHFGVTATVRA
ncbi:MAG: biotin--[acetyl-CoA-carboxylase] ligase [Devosia sp. 67-54]|uniref:biotin--[acetyl-CoA-carboxylase] ligase n=1 Tax=unclassified Devosia TaxID=196773 RepID=UPI00095F5F65|nr:MULTISPECIES: biotin--[acetyl-CoA-carboxylase] ligase [unclassified Devosia]MBN9304288.1 biotin--[acetyl-CoA-carboxylase] ligase [Devosia sp.]OJX18102.1 MAG: biotin--[acetyl-CoA-carboxylase] ligase [Devosia sp. 67-54]